MDDPLRAAGIMISYCNAFGRSFPRRDEFRDLWSHIGNRVNRDNFFAKHRNLKMPCPPVIKHGVLENRPCKGDCPS